jgi:hypothetical protein
MYPFAQVWREPMLRVAERHGASSSFLARESYTAVDRPAPGAPRPAPEPAPLPAPRAGRNEFRCGEKVAFEDKHLNTVVGVIVRINQRTSSIDPGDGTTLRMAQQQQARAGEDRARFGQSCTLRA